MGGTPGRDHRLIMVSNVGRGVNGMNLANQVALITGAGQGIGKAAAC